MSRPSTLAEVEAIEMVAVARMRRDLFRAEATLPPDVIRYVVDRYYAMQDLRKAGSNQKRAGDEDAEPVALLAFLNEQFVTLEGQVARYLGKWAQAAPAGRWAMAQHGIGPVIAAGLGAHVDIEKAPTAGHLYRFAGLDPTIKWLGRDGARRLVGRVLDDGDDPTDWPDPTAMGAAELAELEATLPADELSGLDYTQLLTIARLTNRRVGNIVRLARGDDGRVTRASLTAALAKRPWNNRLKVLSWHAGQSFMKFAASEKCFYGHRYQERKAIEIERNEAGALADQAAAALAARTYGKATVAYQHYSEGRLPPAQIDARARRHAVKLFLSHYHQVAFFARYGALPPAPYPIAHLGHAHHLLPPLSEEVAGLVEAQRAAGWRIG